jgi:hypothetical protein
MRKAVSGALSAWMIITFLVIGQSIYIHTRHGLDGFHAFMQEAPYTNIPITLASVALAWLLVGLLLWLIRANRLTIASIPAWAGFFIVAFSYLNILRERVRYGDIDYYIEAASALFNRQPLPDTYLYPPLWATLLSFLVPFGEDAILLVCWVVNLLSLFLFHYLLFRVLAHYGFNWQAAGLIIPLFLMVNMPIMRTLMYVQVNLHVMNLVFLAILLFQKRTFLSALALALAIHLKASPALLVLAFLLEMNWKWLFWFAVHTLLIAGFTIVIHGPSPFLDFVNNFILLNSPHVLSMRDNSFDSAIGMALSYVRADPALVRVLVYLAKGITLLIGLFLSVRTHAFYPAEKSGTKLFNAIIPLMVAMTLFSPLIWEHHGVFLTLPFLLLLKKMASSIEWILLGTIYLFVFLLPTFDYFPWSYARLPAMLTLLALLWGAQNRVDNDFLGRFNTWSQSMLRSNT